MSSPPTFRVEHPHRGFCSAPQHYLLDTTAQTWHNWIMKQAYFTVFVAGVLLGLNLAALLSVAVRP